MSEKIMSEISSIIHNGLPLNYIRDHSEISVRMLKEWINTDELDNIFGESFRMGDLSLEKLESLKVFVVDNKDKFLEKNMSLMGDVAQQESVAIKDERRGRESEKIIEAENIIEKVLEGEITAVDGYRQVKGLLITIESEAKFIKNMLSSKIEDQVCEETSVYPEENRDFSVTYRKTYDFDAYEPYKEKKAELKELEGLLKSTVDLDAQGKTVCDDEGITIDPIPVKQTRILTYRPKKT